MRYFALSHLSVREVPVSPINTSLTHHLMWRMMKYRIPSLEISLTKVRDRLAEVGIVLSSWGFPMKVINND